MVEPSISTSPVEKLRWKFSMSVAAFHRHHSMNEKSLKVLVSPEVLVSVSLVSSAWVSRGTKKRERARKPFFSPVMMV